MKIGQCIYDVIWKTYSLFVEKKLNISIYARNSFAEKKIKFLKSDIDYTVFLDHLSEIKKTIRFFKLIRKICPVIGEVNLYTKPTLVLIEAYFFNYFEIERDKELLSRLTIGRKIDKKQTSYEALAFLIFNALNDIEDLKKRKHPNHLKWVNHLNRVENCFISDEKIKFLSLVNFKEIISLLVRLSCIVENPANLDLFKFKLYTNLEIGLNSISSEFRSYYFNQHQWLHPDLVSFFPEFYSYLISKKIPLDTFQASIFIERMKLAGLGLIRSSVYYDDYQTSLERLNLFLNIFNFVVIPSELQKDVSFLRMGFVKAQEHLDKIHCSA